MNKDICSILSFYAISPIHAGSGASVATVDLPIQRERHTGYPHIQASSVKGAMRDHFRQNNKEDKMLVNNIFGSDEQDGWNNKEETIPGLISVSDAKLLAFPMRSNIAPFVWVTSPTIMNRLKRDLEYIGMKIDKNFEAKGEKAKILVGNVSESRIILEDIVVKLDDHNPIQVDFIKEHFPDVERLLLISDEMFDYCVSSCTEIQTNIKIDSEMGTAKEGGLRYQEFLPSDSVLYSVVYFSSRSNELQALNIKQYLQHSINRFLQIGGDVTLGKGVCKVNWIDGVTK